MARSRWQEALKRVAEAKAARGAKLDLGGLSLRQLPEEIGDLTGLQELYLRNNQLSALPEWLGNLSGLQWLWLNNNQLSALPESLGNLSGLQGIDLSQNQLSALPEWLGNLSGLQELGLSQNQLSALPEWLGNLSGLQWLGLSGNPLDPALQSAYDAGLDSLRAYLRSLADENQVEPLYEAKLLLVGEGAVGKTTLLKALTGKEPRQGEPTTHGVAIDIKALTLSHPSQTAVQISLNAWDFGGQDVYKPTHQFFFSPRSLYLLVWEPRRGVEQCQVEDWLKLIRLRVGADARVLVVSTFCQTGERLARIDQPVLQRDFGDMIAGFYEVDSLAPDPATGEPWGVPELKAAIAAAAAQLKQMGMPFNRRWRAARDEVLALQEPRISYAQFAQVCATHDMNDADARTLAGIMHDLGYIVYHPDDDELKKDVILQPEWLSKAIGFVLEDRTTAEMDGVLPDNRLLSVWRDHPFANEPHYEPDLYPFFLRLMQKFDVSYRLPDGASSLVAQHVPQARPPLPWLPEDDPPEGDFRSNLVCVMDETPPGLVPWLIVRTHLYATEGLVNGKQHRLHWQKGVFLRHKPHGDALLELRERELYISAQAAWPDYFMDTLKDTVHKLITDNWPGLAGRYSFAVPCPERVGGAPCSGRFDIAALHQFLEEGDTEIRCQACRRRRDIRSLLFGFVLPDLRRQMAEIKADMQKMPEEMASRLAAAVRTLLQGMADEGRAGPRLCVISRVPGVPTHPHLDCYLLQLCCEDESGPHTVQEKGKGAYEFEAPKEWAIKVAPYVTFAARLVKTFVPLAQPGIDALLGAGTLKTAGYEDALDFAGKASARLRDEYAAAGLHGLHADDMAHEQHLPGFHSGVLTEEQRAGIRALHVKLCELDPNQERIGLTRIVSYRGEYRWLCKKHYEELVGTIPETIA